MRTRNTARAAERVLDRLLADRRRLAAYNGFVVTAYGRRVPCTECGLACALHYPRGDRYHEPRFGKPLPVFFES